MIVFKSISIRNFLSYGNVPTIVILDRPGTTFISGEDLDRTESGEESNGVGKSTILNAVAYAVYGKTVSSIHKDKLVNFINKRHMEVVVEFEKAGTAYRVTRARKMKVGAAGNYVILEENGRDITLDTVGNTNRKIEKIMGMPYELFVRIVAFSATNTPFLDLPVRSHYAANQTDIIEELFDLKSLSEKASLLKLQIADTNTALETHTRRIELLEGEHNRHQKQLVSAKRRVLNWEDQNNKEIVQIQRKLKRLEGVDFELQKSLYEQLSFIDKNLRSAMDEQHSIERKLKTHRATVEKKTTELTHLRDDRCPYCLQKYQNTEDKITETEKELVFSKNEITQLDVELATANTSVEKLAATHKSTKAQITVNDLEELAEIKSRSDYYQKRILELENTTNPFLEPLEELEQVELDTIDKTDINKLQNKLDHQKFLLKLLTKKDSFVRKILLDKNIPFLNQRLTHYLQELGLPHNVEFTHEMTASISMFGRPLDFGNLSNGQRARVNLALSFAFGDVLQNMHEQVNICMLDEVLDVGLDAVGVQKAASMLKRKARNEKLSIYIISHRDELDSAFDHKMIVEMSKGFSYVKFEEQ